MPKGLTSVVSARTAAEPVAPKRRQLVAWSRPVNGDGDGHDCGIMRVEGRKANLTTFMFIPKGIMHDEYGNVFRVEVEEVTAHFISDTATVIDGQALTGSRWRVPSHDLYLFVAWNVDQDLNQEGELIETDPSFGTAYDRWPVTLSSWPRR